jgi:hypothetical protein
MIHFFTLDPGGVIVHPDYIIHWIENLLDPLGPSLKQTGRKRY